MERGKPSPNIAFIDISSTSGGGEISNKVIDNSYRPSKGLET